MERVGKFPDLLTIHNLAFHQGLFIRESLGRINAPDTRLSYTMAWNLRQVSFLKAGHNYSNHLTT
jgi:glycogen synthase